MKTKEQILKWLEKEGISKEFFENADKIKAKLRYDSSLIIGAFAWNMTKQGHAFWSEYDKKYLEFYNSEEQLKEMEQQFHIGDIVRVKTRMGDPDDYAYFFTNDMVKYEGQSLKVYKAKYDLQHNCKYPDDGYKYFLETEKGTPILFSWASSMLESVTVSRFIKRKHQYKLNFKN